MMGNFWSKRGWFASSGAPVLKSASPAVYVVCETGALFASSLEEAMELYHATASQCFYTHVVRYVDGVATVAWDRDSDVQGAIANRIRRPPKKFRVLPRRDLTPPLYTPVTVYTGVEPL